MPSRHVTRSASSKRARYAADIVIRDGWAFLSGLQAIDLDDDKTPIPEMIEAQTRKTLTNLDTLLADAGLRREDVVSVRIYLTDIKRFFDRMNTAYEAFFPTGQRPARTCVGVSQLTRGASIEMEFVVRVPDDGNSR